MSSVTDVGPETGAIVAHRSRRGLKIVVALVAAAVALVVAGGGALYAWDSSYAGRVLPGVTIGGTDLSGMTGGETLGAIAKALPYDTGTLVLRTPDGDVRIAFADLGRHANIDALTDQALAVGRGGGFMDRIVGELRVAREGTRLVPEVVFDEDAVAKAVDAVAARLVHAPTDATITMTAKGVIEIGRSRTGRTADSGPAAGAAIDAIRQPDAPSEIVIPVPVTIIRPAVEDAVVFDARTAAVRLARDLKVGFRDRTWTIRATRIRSWVRFEPGANGSIVPVVDEAKIPAVFGKSIARAVKQDPKSAQYLISRSGRIVGVVASSTGRKLDPAATTAAVVAALNERATGRTPLPVKIQTAVVMPRLGTSEAARKAPVMSLLGSWKTWFPISERNFNGANIWVPAKLINGTVLQPGEAFDWWDAIWPVTTARGFGPGGVIRVDHTEPTGALGGGMCSSSTTLFNAAMRAGLDMGARSNHRYYINRYPLGLDATVSIIGGGRQSMTFRNDMKHPIFIRGIRIQSGGVGWVRYEIWGIPEGRTVSLSRPSASNVRQATTNEVVVDTLPTGVRNQVEYPSNGMDVAVTRVVRDGKGRVIHRNVWVSHYMLWNGIIQVGR
ncbi:MAG: VanW family protein [Candidatus Limnocylindrales bacterium]